MKTISRYSLILLLLLFKTQAHAQYNYTIGRDPEVRIGTLPNGFTYYIRKCVEPKNRAIFYLVNKVGSVLEDDNQRGLAHFLEHMGFDGTTNFPKNQLIDYLQKSGVRFGADLNAYTSFDETVYQLPIPTEDYNVIKNGIQIMHDWAQGALLLTEDINRERNVVLEEKRLRLGANQRMQEKTYPIIYHGSRYAERIPIGTDEVLNSFKPETIKKFYHDWYRPDLQALIAVGDFDPDVIEARIKEKFADLKNPDGERERDIYQVPLNDTSRFIAVTDKEASATTAEFLFKHPAHFVQTEGDYLNMMSRSIFNIMIQNRFRELNKETGNPFVTAQAGIGTYPGNMEVLRFAATASPGQLENSLKAIWRENIRAIRFGFTESELRRAKTYFYSSKYYAVKQKEKISSITYVKQYMQNFLRGDAIPDEDTELKMTVFFLPKITLKDLNSTWHQYTTRGSHDIIITAPEKDKAHLPDEATVKNWMNDVIQEDMKPYIDSIVTQAPLIAKSPGKSKVTNKQVFDDLGVTELTLSNGVKVVLKPTEFNNLNILFSAFAPGGTSLYSNADYPSANTAIPIVTGGGVGDLNSMQLLKLLENKSASVTPYITEHLQGVNGSCFASTLEMALQLTNLYFTKPRKDTASFNNFMSKYKSAQPNRRSNPNNIYNDTVNNVLGRLRHGTPGMKSVTLDKAFNIYQERFADASNFTFVFVGKFEVGNITSLVEKYLGTLPSTYKHEQAVDLKDHIKDGKIQRTVYAGADNKATVKLIYSGDYNYTSECNQQFNALNEVLKIRLIERLRLQESGIYSTDVSTQLSKTPAARYTFTITFTCAPENVEKLIAAAQDEIDKIKTNGPGQVNIDKYKTASALAIETQLKNNIFWLSYLTAEYENSGDINDITHYKTRLENVTPASLKDIASQYLSGTNFARLVMLPESYKPAVEKSK